MTMNTPESWDKILKAMQYCYTDHRDRDPIIAQFWRDMQAQFDKQHELPKYLQDDLERSQLRLRALLEVSQDLTILVRSLVYAAMGVLQQSNSKWYDEPEEWQNQLIDLQDRLHLSEPHAVQILARAREHIKNERANYKS
jgi:hypothetical protein